MEAKVPAFIFVIFNPTAPGICGVRRKIERKK
jgi:hypothetical protein